MRINRVDRLVTIEQRTDVRDEEYGQPVRSWSELDKVWARRIEEQGNETIISNAPEHQRTVRWVTRYRSDITVEMRLLFSSQFYDIRNIIRHDRDQWMTLETNIQLQT